MVQNILWNPGETQVFKKCIALTKQVLIECDFACLFWPSVWVLKGTGYQPDVIFHQQSLFFNDLFCLLLVVFVVKAF